MEDVTMTHLPPDLQGYFGMYICIFVYLYDCSMTVLMEQLDTCQCIHVSFEAKKVTASGMGT
jgi:hypothetical protein